MIFQQEMQESSIQIKLNHQNFFILTFWVALVTTKLAVFTTGASTGSLYGPSKFCP